MRASGSGVCIFFLGRGDEKRAVELGTATMIFPGFPAADPERPIASESFPPEKLASETAETADTLYILCTGGCKASRRSST